MARWEIEEQSHFSSKRQRFLLGLQQHSAYAQVESVGDCFCVSATNFDGNCQGYSRIFASRFPDISALRFGTLDHQKLNYSQRIVSGGLSRACWSEELLIMRQSG